MNLGRNLLLPGWLAMWLVGSLYSLHSFSPFLISEVHPHLEALILGPPLSVCKPGNFIFRSLILSLEVIKELSQIRHERKATNGRDKALSHVMDIPAGSGGSVRTPAQLIGAGGTEQT